MKVFGIIIGLVVVAFVVILFVSNTSNPSPRDAIYFVQDNVAKEMKDPDSAKFEAVRFYPDSSAQGESISGYVCGYVNAKNSFGAYVGNRKFLSKVTVSNNGRTSEMTPPFIEDISNSVSFAAMNKLWSENCH